MSKPQIAFCIFLANVYQKFAMDRIFGGKPFKDGSMDSVEANNSIVSSYPNIALES